VAWKQARLRPFGRIYCEISVCLGPPTIGYWRLLPHWGRIGGQKEPKEKLENSEEQNDDENVCYRQ
jgi:hypothetical protein